MPWLSKVKLTSLKFLVSFGIFELFCLRLNINECICFEYFLISFLILYLNRDGRQNRYSQNKVVLGDSKKVFVILELKSFFLLYEKLFFFIGQIECTNLFYFLLCTNRDASNFILTKIDPQFFVNKPFENIGQIDIAFCFSFTFIFM